MKTINRIGSLLCGVSTVVMTGLVGPIAPQRPSVFRYFYESSPAINRFLICRPFLTLLRGTAMASLVRALLPAVALSAALTAAPVAAVSPQNPYRTFNLSGINYGSMQWERAQREGRRVWPYYNAPSRTVTARSGAWVGAVAGGGGGVGTVVEAGGSRSVPRSTPRTFRRWRR
jgi:hypothetical protein